MIPPTSAWNLPTLGSSSFPLSSQDSSGFSPAACTEGARRYETYVHIYDMHGFRAQFLVLVGKIVERIYGFAQQVYVPCRIRGPRSGYFLNPEISCYFLLKSELRFLRLIFLACGRPPHSRLG